MNSYEVDAARIMVYMQQVLRADGRYAQWYMVPSPDQPDHGQSYRVMIGHDHRALYWIGITMGGMSTRREQVKMHDLPVVAATLLAAALDRAGMRRPRAATLIPDDPYLAGLVQLGYDRYDGGKVETDGAGEE